LLDYANDDQHPYFACNASEKTESMANPIDSLQAKLIDSVISGKSSSLGKRRLLCLHGRGLSPRWFP
jgi:hypothetical protein